MTFQGAPHDELQLPGGGIDPGEQPIEALHREVLEETGWRIGAPRLIGIFRRFVFMPEYGIHAEKLCRVYRVRPVLRLSAALDADHRPVWTDPALAAAAVRNPIDRFVLARYAATSGENSTRIADRSSGKLSAPRHATSRS